jgi:hypothetical protein
MTVSGDGPDFERPPSWSNRGANFSILRTIYVRKNLVAVDFSTFEERGIEFPTGRREAVAEVVERLNDGQPSRRRCLCLRSGSARSCPLLATPFRGKADMKRTWRDVCL